MFKLGHPFCTTGPASGTQHTVYSSGAVVQWCSGAVVQWCSGAVVQWCSGAVVQWCSGAVVQWCSGAVVHTCAHVRSMMTVVVHSFKLQVSLSRAQNRMVEWCHWLLGTGQEALNTIKGNTRAVSQLSR